MVTLEELTKKGIDTFGVVIKSFPGTVTLDSCYSGLVPKNAVVYWKTKGLYFIKKVKGGCEEKPMQIDSVAFLTFAISNFNVLEKEVIMPIILEAERRNGKLVYQGLFDSHLAEYIFYYRVANSSHAFRFVEDVFMNKQSWFYTNNVRTKSFELFQIIKRQLTIGKFVL